ncbi:hypothetical protein [Salarchaeum sp. JOR-1]|uniref:DUF7521 family protein n=1 Tax=Salarchaeum sp. JOR-1 TaxID=2599399 RepID=UPI001198C651|nr:hypothetical protein [Salarchaeum sp. JOR-1]QDX39450.1 hypothetical protein FQU85_00620 [Salarchaeum sp. JOR-1]
MSALTTVAIWQVVLDAFLVCVGGLVSVQAYRGYRRHDSTAMLAVAVGTLVLVLTPFLLEYVFEAATLVTPLQSAILRQGADSLAVLVILYALVR